MGKGPYPVTRSELETAAEIAQLFLDERDPSYHQILRAQTAAEVMRRKTRQLAEDDLFFFEFIVLDFADMSPNLHGDMCDFVSSPTNQLLIVPRGHLKSSTVSVGYVLWLVLKYPDVRVLIANATLDNPEKWIAEQLGHLRGNKVLRWLFPEAVPAPGKEEVFGFKNQWTSPARTAPWREASVECTSVDKNVVSRHYEVIIFDDLVSDENSRSLLGLERTKKFYKDAQALLQGQPVGGSRYKVPKTHVKVVGTRWHFNDLYSDLLNRRPPMDSFQRKAIEDGELIFPEMFSREELAARRLEMGSAGFSAHYMNDPVDPDSMIFSPDKVVYYQDVPHEPMAIVATVDLAVSEKTYADESAVVVSGVTADGTIYVLDYRAGTWAPERVIRAVYEMYDKWKPTWVFFENNNYQASFKHLMFLAGQQRGYQIPVWPVRAIGEKFTRILALQPYFEAGKLRIRESMQELEDQLTMFPKTKHDDVIDALAMRVQKQVWAQSNMHISKVGNGNTWDDVKRDIAARLKRNGQERVEAQSFNSTPWFGLGDR